MLPAAIAAALDSDGNGYVLSPDVDAERRALIKDIDSALSPATSTNS